MWGDRARSALAGSPFADVRWVPETGSTNADLLALARAGTPANTTLVADHQTGGRGRLGRTWQAPPGSSLLVSILFRPHFEPRHLHLLSTAVALAARSACARVADTLPALKWPNDLMAPSDKAGSVESAGGKLGGVLAESVVEAGIVQAVVVGIGLNVNWPDRLPAELRGIAVALNALAGHDVDREDLLAAMLGALGELVEGIDDQRGRSALTDAYRAACATIGQSVRVELAGGELLVGRAVEVDDDGRLVLDVGARAVEGARPALRVVTVGDVVHLRPA